MIHRVTCLPSLFLILVLCGTASAESPTFCRITVDGYFDDWANVPVAHIDPTGDHGNQTIDLQSIWLANDDEFLYIRLQTGDDISFQNSSLRIYIDTDNNPATGFTVGAIGSDLALLMPERRWVEQTSSQFQAAIIGHGLLDSLVLPTYAADEFELRVRRDTLFPVRGTPVLGNPQISIVIIAGNDRAPNGAGGILYTFSDGDLPPYPDIPIDRACPNDLRVVTWNMLWDGIFDRPEQFQRVLSALQPDVICFEELSESSTALRNQLNNLLPLPGGATWNVYKGYTNAIASPYPLTMTRDDTIPATGRRQAMALVNLPNDQYDVNLYVICVHYKCCGTLNGAEDAQRQRHSDANVNWLRVARSPGGAITLPAGTPIIITGDYNIVGGRQPLTTMETGDIVDQGMFGPPSPPDWDGTPLANPLLLHNAASNAYTWRWDTSSFMPGRLDFTLYTDSVMTAGRLFLLSTRTMSPAALAAAGLQQNDTVTASDHLPIVVDFRMTKPADVDLSGTVDSGDIIRFVEVLLGIVTDECSLNTCDLNRDGKVDAEDIAPFVLRYLGS